MTLQIPVFALMLLSASSALSQPLAIDSFRITSSFGEYRHRHFHAGFDYSTFGKTGVPVLALDDGVLFRASFSPWGYGKNLWLLTKNGLIVRYVHLSRFSERVDSLVFFYRQTHRCDTGTVEMAEKVRKGQVIAYSGETGAGLPLLHMEIYDSGGRLINPWELGLRYPDPNPPVIRGVSAVPREPGALIEGLPWEVFYPASVDTIRVQGAFGIMLWAHDLWGTYVGIRAGKLWIDDSLVFSVDFKMMNPEMKHWSDAVYAFQGGWNSKTPIRCYCLSPKEDLMCFRALPELKLKPGVHTGRAQVQDYPGHKTEIRFAIKVGPCKPALHEPVAWDYKDDTLAFKAFDYGTLLKTKTRIKTLKPAFKNGEFLYYWMGTDTTVQTGELSITTKTIGPAGDSAHAWGLVFKAKPGALASPVRFAFVRLKGKMGLFPRFPPCLEKCHLSLEKPEHGFLFRANSRFQAIRCIGPDTGAKTSRFGFITSAKDTTKPVIKPLSTKASFMSFKIRDTGTGVRKVSLFVDGHWVPGDYDPEKGIFSFSPIQALARGRHPWRLLAVDLAGNQRELQGAVEAR